ncbi:hypothetical protein [Vibrio mediterranei]|uniref:hypothetical protein n=1 Tax=Vibrio mediterranei TaxID=689 RepID=UPI004067BEBC
MDKTLLSVENARKAIRSLNGSADRINLPAGIKVRKADEEYAIHWHNTHRTWKNQRSNVSLYISGRYDGEEHRTFSGEVRLFLREDKREDKKYEIMLFARVGLSYGFHSTDLLNKQEQGIDCPFVYQHSLEAALQVALARMQYALEIGENTDCSKWKAKREKDRKARAAKVS